jgi:hypothetical protein
MSIVICAIQNNKKFVIAADKRAITNGVVRDDYKKILQLRTGIFYGMTGSAELGQRFFDSMLKPRSNFNSKAIISFVDNEFTAMPQKLTMTIAGRDEENNFFIWQKNNKGILKYPQVGDDLLTMSIAANENVSIPRLEDYFLLQQQFVPLEEAVVLTIRYAAENDRDKTISQECDLHMMS